MFYPILSEHGNIYLPHDAISDTVKCSKNCPAKGLIKGEHVHIRGYYDFRLSNIISKFSLFTYMERSAEVAFVLVERFRMVKLTVFCKYIVDIAVKLSFIGKDLNKCGIRFLDRYSVLLSSPVTLLCLRVLYGPSITRGFLVVTFIIFATSNWIQYYKSKEIEDKIQAAHDSHVWCFKNVDRLQKLTDYCKAVGFFQHAKTFQREVDKITGDFNYRIEALTLDLASH